MAGAGCRKGREQGTGYRGPEKQGLGAKGRGGRDILSHKGSGLGAVPGTIFRENDLSRNSGPRSYSAVAGEGSEELIHVKVDFAEELGQVAFALLGRE